MEMKIRPSGEMFSFDLAIAKAYGINEALIIRHLQYWIRYNKKVKKNYYIERFWTYQTYQQISDHIQIINYEQVKYAIENLVDLKVLRKGNFNKSRFDNTTWYAFEEENIYAPDLVENSNNSYERENSPSIGKFPSSTENFPSPIPDTIPSDSKSSDKKEKNNKKKVCSAIASLLVDYLLANIKKLKEDFPTPNLITWGCEIDKLLKEGISEERIRQLIDFIFQHKFWKAKILSASSLVKKFHQLEIESKVDVENQYINFNRGRVMAWKKENPEVLRPLQLNGNFVVHLNKNGKEICLNMQPEAFESAFMHLAGVKYV